MSNKHLPLGILEEYYKMSRSLSIEGLLSLGDWRWTSGGEAIILDSYTDEFGNWINIMNVESRTIEPISAKTEIGLRWTEKELYI